MQQFKFVEYQTRYKHFIGFIENDEYYSCLPLYVPSYVNSGDIFMAGRNPYELSGYGDAKKYCGYEIRAVKTDEGMLQVFSARNQLGEYGVEFDGWEERFDQRIIPESEHKELMNCHPIGCEPSAGKTLY